MKRLFLLGALLLSMATSQASTVTTQVLVVRSNATPSGATRISVLTSGTTACSTQGWFSFEYLDGVGKVWVASLLAAQASGREVRIFGTGACDQYAVEKVDFMDALP